ncbi:MAG: L-threonylcarbamoyladenylate synthase [Patescibacteria group bacterium]|nr:L-threonylcarbamoyladenylate synthase [Patescibacteria group bacterium]
MQEIEKAIEILKKGGIIAYPTDTLYGIGCNVFDLEAVQRVFELKNRDFSKPLSIAVSDFKMLDKIAFTTEEEKAILKKLLPGSFTIILLKKPIISDLITAGSRFVGIRIPEHEITLELIKKADFPIITTSANISGNEPPVSAKEVDLEVQFMLRGECKHKKPSTVIDLKNRKIIRQGVGKISNL